jgi:hypothetical protein
MAGDWRAERHMPDFLGLTLPEAQARARALGLEVRVLRDGTKHYGQKMNLSQRRVNLWLDDGRVTGAKRF